MNTATRLNHRGLAVLLFLSCLFLLPSDAAAQSPPLWGDLKAGPYGVAFKTIKVHDRTRAAKRKVAYDGSLTAGERALPMLISVWYPARRQPGAPRLTYGRYLYLGTVEETFEPAGEENLRTAKENLKAFYERPNNFPYGKVPDDRWQRLMQAEGIAVEGAAGEAGPFPLVVGTGGPLGHFILDEYLASHGYVVARVASLGDLGLTGILHTELGVRNLEFLIGHMQDFPGVDRNKLAAIGMSAGGFSPYLLAMRNSDVDAVVAMESALFHDNYAPLLKPTPHYDVTRLRVPFLHMYRRTLSEGGENLKDFEALRYSRRYRYLLNPPNLLHQDFSTHGVAATTVLDLRGADRPAAKRAFETTWHYVLQFLNAHVKKDQSGLTFLARTPEQNGLPSGFLSVELRDAVRPAPSVAEFLDLIETRGMEQAARLFAEAKQADPEAELYRVNTLINLGYRLLNRQQAREAIEVFKLGESSHPGSARIYAGLSDGYTAAESKELAIQYAEKSLVALAADADLTEAQRTSMRNNLAQNIERLKAR